VDIKVLVSLGLLAFTARSRRVFFPDTEGIRHDRPFVHGIEVFLGPNLARVQRTFCFDAVGLVAIGPFYDILVVILLVFSTVTSADVCAHVCTWVGRAVCILLYLFTDNSTIVPARALVPAFQYVTNDIT